MSLRKKNIYVQLFKLGILVHACLTTTVGYVFALGGDRVFVLSHYLSVILGLACIFAGSAALNHVMEHRIDAKMQRTENRPIPSGKLSCRKALGIALALLLTGSLVLFIAQTYTSLAVAWILVLLYNGVYTALKRYTWLNTFVGSFPGAIPPLCGWLAVTTNFHPVIFFIFGVFFFWQMPHFFSIAWIYREDYARGGIKMLACQDPDGNRTIFHTTVHTLLMGGCILALGIVDNRLGMTYFLVNSLNLLYFFCYIVIFHKSRTDKNAKKLMFVSIIFQFVYVIAMLVDYKI